MRIDYYSRAYKRQSRQRGDAISLEAAKQFIFNMLTVLIRFLLRLSFSGLVSVAFSHPTHLSFILGLY